MAKRALRPACAVGAALLLQACVMVPVTKHRFEPSCRAAVKEMTLEPVQLASIGGCSNEGCVAIVALAGATAAVSAVVSGSVVVIGNVVYWMERAGRCDAPGAAPATVPPAAPAVTAPREAP